MDKEKKKMMKKQKIQFVVVLLLVIVFTGGYFGMKKYQSVQEEKEAAESEAEKIYITETDASDITALTYQLDGVTMSFTKEDETWTYDADPSIDIDESSIETMLYYLDHLTATEMVDTTEELSAYGFDEPTNVITYTAADQTTTLTVGMVNPITADYYLTSDQSDGLYLVSSSFATAFTAAVDDLIAEADTETEAVEPVESTE